MAMDFFAAQDRARGRTRNLVLLFLLGVFLTIASVGAAVGGIFYAMMAGQGNVTSYDAEATLKIAGIVSGITALVVLIGVLVGLAKTGGTGAQVATMLGASRMGGVRTDAGSEQVANIVEEMAIASGLPVPPVFMMPDQTINAFAAGKTPNDAVIGLTEGACSQLSRDELQGVVAHEFSHIFHGDMRINARTTGLVFGLMAVGVMGWLLVRMAPHLARSSGRGKGKGNGAAAALFFLLIGIVIWIIGSIGTLFGRLVQAAVCRQREFLADASAVQYTRNPAGIAGALRQIAHAGSTTISSRTANECSHFFFGPAVNSLFATHPPIAERIRRIEGVASLVPVEGGGGRAGTSTEAAPAFAAAGAAVAGFAGGSAPAERTPRTPVPVTSGQLRAALATAGSTDAGSTAVARTAIDSIPPGLRASIRAPLPARGAVYAVAALAAGDGPHDAARAVLEQHDQEALTPFDAMLRELAAVGQPSRLVLVDLCVPALCTMERAQADHFSAALLALLGADGTITMPEWVVRMRIRSHVLRRFSQAGGTEGPTSFAKSASLVLATLSGIDQGGAVAQEAFAQACAEAGLAGTAAPTSRERTYRSLEQALEDLDRMRGSDKARFVQACMRAVLHDGTCSAVEAEAFRSVCDALGSPLPPIIAA